MFDGSRNARVAPDMSAPLPGVNKNFSMSFKFPVEEQMEGSESSKGNDKDFTHSTSIVHWQINENKRAGVFNGAELLDDSSEIQSM